MDIFACHWHLGNHQPRRCIQQARSWAQIHGHGLEDTPRKGPILDQDWDTTEIQPEIYDYILYTVL